MKLNELEMSGHMWSYHEMIPHFDERSFIYIKDSANFYKGLNIKIPAYKLANAEQVRLRDVVKDPSLAQ